MGGCNDLNCGTCRYEDSLRVKGLSRTLGRLTFIDQIFTFVPFPTNHRSTSPNTKSIVPIIATASANR